VSGAAPEDAQVDARLWDVDGANQRLVARGTLRPSGGATDTWELHANGWRFAKGHVAKLELLSSDAPYARPSNSAFTVGVSDLDLRLPTREAAPSTGAPSPAGGDSAAGTQPARSSKPRKKGCRKKHKKRCHKHRHSRR
jgi:hypothetical protein